MSSSTVELLAVASPSFSHLRALSDRHGVFEHALLDVPRREHGYCTDDVARALIVVVREPCPDASLDRLADTYLSFLESAVQSDGSAHNRMDADGAWRDRSSLGDWWGRAVWALGVTSACATSESVRARASAAFAVAASVRSVHGRAMAFATLGAAAVLTAHPHHLAARALVLDGAATVATPRGSGWDWPEGRLRYANAVLPEALIAAGAALDSPHLVARGLGLLRFLMDIETRDGRLSVTGTGGRGRSHRAVQFDQQPIEVAAIADACARAFDITGDPAWQQRVALAWRWFLGENDSSTPMFDVVSGAGFDGLEAGGRNENRGAESTLAALSTYQQARRLAVWEAVSA